MIRLENVSDYLSFDQPMELLDRASVEIPAGRYALLTGAPRMRRPIVDLLCGTRPPHQGVISRDGRTSWAIGRTSLFRGSILGSDLLGMFCRIYDLDRRRSEEFVNEMIEYKPMLEEEAEKWVPLARAEFAQAVALLPRFDVYVTDGNVLFSPGRFGALWRHLFEQRTTGRTLIISSFHPSNFVTFCEKALIVDGGAIWIEDELDDAMTRYPPRPPVPETTERDGAAGDGEADDADTD